MPNVHDSHIAVMGDGAWGTVVASMLADSGRSVTMWGHDPKYLDEMRQTRCNRLFLPGFELPADLSFEADFARATESADVVISAVPTKFLRPTFAKCLASMNGDATKRLSGKFWVSLTKGIEQDTMLRPSQIMRELFGLRQVCVVSGPSHAEEVARKLPATVVAADDDIQAAVRGQRLFTSPYLRVYAVRDVVGVEIAGAVKNVIALAAGIIRGLGLGDNTLAALMTRGLAEMRRLGVALGAESETFAGLAGVGDLITTCVSEHGRNRSVGIAIGRGEKLSDILARMNGVAEGVTTTASALELAQRLGVSMPITSEIAAVLWEDKDPRAAVADLMSRRSREGE